GLGHFLHLHPARGPHKQNFCCRVNFPEGIGDRDCRENMPPCATPANNYLLCPHINYIAGISPTITFSVPEFCFSSISLLTLKIIPNAMLVNRMDVPPTLTNGNGTPVTGPKPTATAIFAKAGMVSVKLSPAASKAPKARGLFVTIS